MFGSVKTVGRPFVRRLRGLVSERRLAAVKKPGWVKMRDGFWMHVNPEQYWDKEVIAHGGQWEPGLTHIIKIVVDPGDLCLDIGSHKGYVSCVLAQAVGSSGRVLAFDPDPRLGEELRINMARNGFSQVTYFPLALGDTRSTVTLLLTNTLGWSTSFPNVFAAPDVIKEIDVEASTVDIVLSETLYNKSLSFVKVDAEGAEPLIWQGMQETLSRSSPVIAMEINYSSLKAGAFSLEALHDEIEGQGYTAVFEIKPPRWLGTVTLVPTDIRHERRLLIGVLMVRPRSPGFQRIRSLIA
jgi:FkbM family methyltransferase